MKKGMITFSLATLIIIIMSTIAIGSGIILVKNIFTATELPALQKDIPQFFKFTTFPEKGQIGTVFKLNLELVNKTGIYLIEARISKSGSIIKNVPLYDDGDHGDLLKDDGIYAGIWDSENEQEGIYSISVIINPSEKQIVYENVSSVKIFKQNCEPLIYNGNPDDKVDVVIVPYGYSDLKAFKQDALQWITKGLLTYEPFASNKEKFNFYIINQASDFSCERDNKVKTLIYCNDIKVERFASQCPSDQIVVILNEAEFCGTASFYVKACNGWNLRQVATHEFGHTFGGLGDEYSYSSSYPQYTAVAAVYPNCDIEGCRKWQDIYPGCFKGCGVDELYRPTRENCIMKRYVDIFCPVCRKHIEKLLENYKSGNEILQAAPPTEKTYLIDLKYDLGKLTFKDIYVTKSKAPDRKILRKTDYTGKIISFDGKEIYSFNFELPNMLFLPPPRDENETAASPIVLQKIEWSVLVPQFDNASKLEIYDSKQKKLFTVDIGYLSNSCGNEKCETHESAFECPKDCKENVKDDICSYVKNNICDSDCPEIDPDCRGMNWTLIGLIAISLISIIIILTLTQVKKED
ncbi:MAG: M64 family metallopeptidase [Candidatus Pacearchaeota archaeon]